VTELEMIEKAAKAGMEAAYEKYGCWDDWEAREFEIAELAAREAIAALRQMEAGKDV
jgi:hypothetical protein